MKYQSIALSGFMGSGKSTISDALIKKLYGISVDVDKYIVRAWLTEGKSIKDYIGPNGENMLAFRKIETQAIEQILQKHPRIIALGGGAVTIKENVQMIKEAAYQIVYLKCPFEIIKERIQADEEKGYDGRVPFDEEIFKPLYKSRGPIYEETANIIVETDGKSVSKIVDEILNYMEVA